jgi:hypothetical protein
MTAAVATLSVWRLRRRDLAGALTRVARSRRGWPDVPGLVFARLLGTAGDRFTPLDATPTRWALLAGWSDEQAAAAFEPSAALRWWDRRAVESAAFVLRPLWSRGAWDGAQPFGDGDSGEQWSGPVVALTRSTLRPGRALRFYRAIPPITRDLATSSGLRLTFGVGEAPLLRQGTVSVWDSAAAMRAFTHRTAAHTAAIRATPQVRWYAEEMFTRFALLAATGTFDGRAVAA